MTETKTPMPDCPECEKLSAVSDESNKIGGFLSWLSEQDVILASYDSFGDLIRTRNYQLTDSGINKMLAEYYGIDLDKVEQERRALLDWIREQQEGDE